MQSRSKVLAVLLAAALLLMQIPMAMAGNEECGPLMAAVQAGREVSYSAEAEWHSNPLVDAETSGIIQSLLDALAITGRYAITEGGNYNTMDITLQGESAVSAQTIYTDDGSYFVSSMLPSPMAINADELEQYFSNYMALLKTTTDMSEEDFDMLLGMFTTETQASLETNEMDVDQRIAELGLEPVLEAIEAWTETALAGEAYEDAIESVYGLEIASATLYTLTRDEIVSLVQTILPLLKDNTAFWMFIMEQMDNFPMDAEGNPLPEEDIMAAMADNMDNVMAVIETMPDNITMYYAECYGADGETVTNIAHMMIPAEDENSDAFELYLEWPADDTQAHFVMAFGTESVVVDVLAAERVQDGDTENGRFNVTLSMYEDETVMGLFVFDVTSQKVTAEDGVTNDVRILAGMVDSVSGEEMGMEVLFAAETDLSDEVDVAIQAQMDVNLIMGESTMPLVTLTCDAATGEPQGAPFDPSEIEFTHPGAMDEEAFIAWFNEDVLTSVVQSVFRVMSLLPADVMSVFVHSMQ